LPCAFPSFSLFLSFHPFNSVFSLLLIVTCFSRVLRIDSLQLQWIHVLLQLIHVWLQ
jgi:hypothetical protein